MARVVQTPDRLAALAAHRVPPREEFSEAPAARTPPRTPQQAQMAWLDAQSPGSSDRISEPPTPPRLSLTSPHDDSPRRVVKFGSLARSTAALLSLRRSVQVRGVRRRSSADGSPTESVASTPSLPESSRGDSRDASLAPSAPWRSGGAQAEWRRRSDVTFVEL